MIEKQFSVLLSDSLHEREHPCRPLREHLVNVLIRSLHRSQALENELIRHGLMEQVTQAVHEDPPWLLPMQRDLQAVRMERDVRKGVALARHDPLGIAIATAFRDMRASRHRVPRGSKAAIIAP